MSADPVSSFEAPLTSALKHTLAHLQPSSSQSVAATATLESLRQQLALPLADSALDATQVVEELVQGAKDGIVGSAGPCFFGWVIGGSLPAALAADWLTSAWDQNSGLYTTSPASAVVEETAGLWLKDLLNIPASASFAFVTGCQMAHVTCLAAARHALLAKRGWDVEQQGQSGAPAIHILTSTEKHHSIIKAIRLLGFGDSSLVNLPVDAAGRLQEQALTHALESNPDRPTIVILQAGDLNIGAFDDFATLIPIAKNFGAWVHVDGAFGLWAAASPRFRHLLAGAEAADSWATDGHKWLNVPYDSGYAFVADSQAHRAAVSIRASYLTHADECRDQIDWTPEFSRRGRGFATYAAIRQLGRQGVADLVDRTCDHARAIVTRIGALEGAEALWTPQLNQGLNQGLIRFLDPRQTATDADHDRFTDQVIAEILLAGDAFFTGTTWRGRRAMRVSVCNWQTSPADVDRVVESVRQVLMKSQHEHLGAANAQK